MLTDQVINLQRSTAGTPAGSGWWGSPERPYFTRSEGNWGSGFLAQRGLWNSCFIHGTLNTWCTQALKGIVPISASWGSVMPVVLAAKMPHRHLVFTHTDLAALAAWRKQTAALTSPCPEGKLSVVPPLPHRGTCHCPLIQTVLAILFSSPLWRGHGLIVPSVHPNEYFLIASDYLWGTSSSAGHVTAQHSKTYLRTWCRGWSHMSHLCKPSEMVLCAPFFQGKGEAALLGRHSQLPHQP